MLNRVVAVLVDVNPVHAEVAFEAGKTEISQYCWARHEHIISISYHHLFGQQLQHMAAKQSPAEMPHTKTPI